MTWLIARTPCSRGASLRLTALLFLLLLLGSNATVVWADLDRTSTSPPPTARCCSAIAYDTSAQALLLYGGATMNENAGDMYSWNGTAWTQLTPPTSPGSVYDGAMVADPATSSVVLFGGRGADSQYVLGTWLWSAGNWSQATPTVSPPPRANANLAYDAATSTVVLWGGCCASTGAPFQDTWTWNGTAWQQQFPATSPPGSESASMAYDAATGTVVLLSPSASGATTWTWDGVTWTKQSSPTTPSFGGAMSYDAANQTVVLFQVDGTTWTWTAAGWTEQSPTTAPSARNQAALVYDAATQKVVLFGGSDNGLPQNDLWSWDGLTWTSVSLLAGARPHQHQP